MVGSIGSTLIAARIVSPERWDHLPEAVEALPGLYSNLLTFSAGPRVCISLLLMSVDRHGDNLLVLHRHALLDDRDEDIPVRSSDQLRFRGDREESFQSQLVSGLGHFLPYGTAHPPVFLSVLTRPYVSGQFKKGSQCPLLVKKVGS